MVHPSFSAVKRVIQKNVIPIKLRRVLMRHALLGIAMVTGFLFMASSAFANPALMKKHEGYPDETGKATTSTGEAAAAKAAADAPKVLKDQLRSATEPDHLKRGGDSRLPQVTDPGYVGKGVTESHIKDATKVNAAPK
jgi:hypothetical protein